MKKDVLLIKIIILIIKRQSFFTYIEEIMCFVSWLKFFIVIGIRAKEFL